MAWIKVHMDPVPEAKDLLVVTPEKRTISFLSVPGRILDDADSANRINFVPSQSVT